MQNKNRTEHKNKCKEKGGGETHATSTAAGVLAAGRKGGARKAGAGVGSGGRVGRSARDGDPSKLDIRVGVIVKAWKHPDSDKLYCDEVDLGEDKTRMIASGLRPFYTLDEMQGRRVIVMANMRTRSMGGFKSEGMD
eukprot:jgi/Undpi1/4633/HiC_scaffold_18.g07987.m1